VIDLRSIRPLDTQTIIRSVQKTHRFISVEEGWPYAGIGAELGMMLCEKAFDELDHQPMRICHEDVPLPYAQNLEKLALPNAHKIVDAVLSMFKKG